MVASSIDKFDSIQNPQEQLDMRGYLLSTLNSQIGGLNVNNSLVLQNAIETIKKVTDKWVILSEDVFLQGLDAINNWVMYDSNNNQSSESTPHNIVNISSNMINCLYQLYPTLGITEKNSTRRMLIEQTVNSTAAICRAKLDLIEGPLLKKLIVGESTTLKSSAIEMKLQWNSKVKWSEQGKNSTELSLKATNSEEYAVLPVNLTPIIGNSSDEFGISSIFYKKNIYRGQNFSGLVLLSDQAIDLKFLNNNTVTLPVSNLTDNFTFYLDLNKELYDKNSTFCTWFDESINSFSYDGCISEYDNKTEKMKCICNHLSYFSIVTSEASYAAIAEETVHKIIAGRGIIPPRDFFKNFKSIFIFTLLSVSLTTWILYAWYKDKYDYKDALGTLKGDNYIARRHILGLKIKEYFQYPKFTFKNYFIVLVRNIHPFLSVCYRYDFFLNRMSRAIIVSTRFLIAICISLRIYRINSDDDLVVVNFIASYFATWILSGIMMPLNILTDYLFDYRPGEFKETGNKWEKKQAIKNEFDRNTRKSKHFDNKNSLKMVKKFSATLRLMFIHKVNPDNNEYNVHLVLDDQDKQYYMKKKKVAKENPFEKRKKMYQNLKNDAKSKSAMPDHEITKSKSTFIGSNDIFPSKTTNEVHLVIPSKVTIKKESSFRNIINRFSNNKNLFRYSTFDLGDKEMIDEKVKKESHIFKKIIGPIIVILVFILGIYYIASSLPMLNKKYFWLWIFQTFLVLLNDIFIVQMLRIYITAKLVSYYIRHGVDRLSCLNLFIYNYIIRHDAIVIYYDMQLMEKVNRIINSHNLY